MSNTRLQHFRNILTERFTSVAVEIFGEVENIVEAYYEENKRLRTTLHMVLSPKIKLSKIDISRCTGATQNFREQLPQLNTDVDLEISEPLPEIPKEEQTEYDISLGSETQGHGGAENVFSPDVENENDFDMPCITNSFQIQAVEKDCNSSTTMSADNLDDEIEDMAFGYSDAATDFLQISSSEGSTNQHLGPEKHQRKSKKKWSKSSLQKTMLEFPRMMPYKSFIGETSDQSLLERLTEAFKDIPDDKKPLITKMGLTEKVELDDCALKVTKGCPPSYQCPAPSSQDYKTYDDAPPRPLLPLGHHRLEPVLTLPRLSAKEQRHVKILMEITWETAYSMEHATRQETESTEEFWKMRLTSCFWEICNLKPGRRDAENLIFKIKKETARWKTARKEKELKTEALRVYCRNLCVNWSSCGLVVNPNAPWLGALPDGLVYDPNETPNFGLVHVNCTSHRSFIECQYLICKDGVLQLKKSHSHYWNMQGEMMVTGMSWCDLLVFSEEDILVQRIYRDKDIIKVMKKKLDDFYFRYYLPGNLN